MQARRIARELALLSISQLPSQPQHLETKTIEDMVLAAVRSLIDEAKETLAVASAELQRSNDKLLISETRAADLHAARAMTRESIQLTEAAINRVGSALDFPELLQISKQDEIRHYAIELLSAVHEQRSHIDTLLNSAMVDWQMSRLARIDQDILRLATADMVYLNTPTQVSINESVELAKRYSSEDGYRFINGILRGVSNQLKLHPRERATDPQI